MMVQGFGCVGAHAVTQSFADAKLFALPPQPPYVNVSHLPDEELKKKRRIAASHGPLSDGSVHAAPPPSVGPPLLPPSMTVTPLDPLLPLLLPLLPLLPAPPSPLTVEVSAPPRQATTHATHTTINALAVVFVSSFIITRLWSARRGWSNAPLSVRGVVFI
jgi:hypothetical protein